MHQSDYFPFLKADEIPDPLRILDGYAGSRLIRIATKLPMITNVRTTELRATLWSEFDLNDAIREIPAERMEMRRTHLVPSSIQALDLPNELKIMTGNYRYAFLGRSDPNRPMSETSINQVIGRIGHGRKVAGYGLRHTLSTIPREQGFESAQIEIQLVHVDKNPIRGTYNHAQYFNGRKSMMDWYSNLIFEGPKRS